MITRIGTAFIFFLTTFVCSAQQSESLGEEIIDVLDRAVTEEDDDDSLLDERLNAEENIINQNFAITQYKANYILPVTYVSNPNELGNDDLTEDNIDNAEAKYQLSFKLPLYSTGDDTDGVYFGFTVVAFWQVYNEEVSRPFRETNYEPEIFYQWQTDYEIFGIDFNLLQAGFSHQSNGQSGLRSRSWNRLTLSSLFSTENAYYYVKAWYRIPEDEKEDPLDPTGDDNPNIQDFVGRSEIGYGYQFDKLRLSAVLRNNLRFSDNRGSIELTAAYPLSERYFLMLQYFNGYGDSLIDFDRAQERIGIGVQLRLL